MKKRILITTFNKAHNYGAMLQEYALLQTVSQNNIAEILNYDDKNIKKNYRLLNLGYGNLVSRLKQLLKSILFYPKNKKRYNSFKRFERNNIVLTKKYNNIKELNKSKLDYDIFITGSDQVWNPTITNGLSDIYTLNFGPKQIKRISYAASVGNSKNIKKYKNQYLEKLDCIDVISVREKSAEKEFSKIIKTKEIKTVLDPTLLLTKKEWENVIINNKMIESRYILAYEVEENEEFVKIANFLSEKTGYKIIHFSQRNKNRLKNVLFSAYIYGPFDFIHLIRNSELVITTSFHATVFSIIFNKKFWTVPHVVTGSRVTDLLKTLNIESRAIKTLKEFKTRNYNEPINYTKVNKALEIEREKSIKWLNNALK